MISSTTAYILLAVYGLLIPVYYVVRRYIALSSAVRADESSVRSLKQEIKDGGCTDEIIDFWLLQDFQWRSAELQRRDEKTARIDVIFYIFCVSSALLVLLLTEQ